MRERCASIRRATWVLVGSVLPLWSIALSSDKYAAVPDASTKRAEWNFELSADGVLHALDDTGKIRWSHNCTSLVLPTAPSPDWKFNDDEARNYWKGLINETPFYTEQGLVVGNAATTVEVIDQTTGKLLFKFLPDGSFTRPAEVQAEPVNALLFKQVQYSLQCLAIPDGKVNWALNWSEITLVTYAPEVVPEAKSKSLVPFHSSSPALIKQPEQERGILFSGSNYVPVPVHRQFAASGLYSKVTNVPVPVHPLVPASAFGRPPYSYSNSSYHAVRAAGFLPAPPTPTTHFWHRYEFAAAFGVMLMFLAGLGGLLWSWVRKKKNQKAKARRRKKRANGRKEEQQQEEQRLQQAEFVLTEEVKRLGNGVFEGRLEDKPVAAKRFPLEQQQRAQAEKVALSDIGYHPNVVHCLSLRQVDQYVYVVVERCQYDLRRWVGRNEQQCPDERKEKVINLCRGLLEGIKHIHDSGYMHRDLKPESIWIHENEKKNNVMTPKIAGSASCKQLPDDYDEDLEPEPGTGTEGWRAPEQVESGRSHTRAMDMFNFACLMFFCLTGGEHPFGAPAGRDGRVSRGERDIWQVDHEPLIKHLLNNLLDSDPNRRLSAGQAKEHPLFWEAEKRLRFLCLASSRVEQAYRTEQENSSAEEVRRRMELRARIEELEPLIVGNVPWDRRLDPRLVKDIEQNKRSAFDYTSLKDLLRAIRNKWTHFDELSMKEELKGPDGYEKYFPNKYPSLFMEVYAVFQDICGQEIEFQAFFYPPETT